MPVTGTRTLKRYTRNKAATLIQAAFRGTRARKNMQRKIQYRNRQINRALLKKEPVQYSIFGKDSVNISQTPILFANISNMTFDRDNTNPTYYRSSSKVKPMNLHAVFRIEA